MRQSVHESWFCRIRGTILSISIPTTISIQRGDVSDDPGAMGQVSKAGADFDTSEQGGCVRDDEVGSTHRAAVLISAKTRSNLSHDSASSIRGMRTVGSSP